MTPETRETLERLLAHADALVPDARKLEYGWQRADRLVSALRDVLTPRTCGTCRYSNERPIDGWAWCFRKDQMWSVDDGCIKGWQAREGEGGGK